MPCEIHTSLAPRARDRGTGLPACPHCGDTLVAPDISTFHGAETDGLETAGHGVVRHVWSCESCGEQSETAVLVVH